MIEINNVGIIGCGRMGPGIFDLMEPMAYRTVLYGRRADVVEAQRLRVLKTLEFSQREGVISEEEFHRRKENMHFTSSLADLSECDLIIEAIAESATRKRELFKELDGLLKPESILTTTSSSIVPSAVAPSKKWEPRTFGLHFFYPPKIIGVVEVIQPPNADPEVQETLTCFLSDLDKSYLLESEEEPFVVNRVVLPLQAQAYRVVENGRGSFAQVDRLVKDRLGLPGVFELFDKIGIDVAYPCVARYARMQSSITDFVAPLERALGRLAEGGRTGTKSGAGFYDYEDGKIKLTEKFSPLPEDVEKDMLQRLRLLLVNQVFHFVDRAVALESDIESAVEEAYGMDAGIQQWMTADHLHEFGRELNELYRKTGAEVFRPQGPLVPEEETSDDKEEDAPNDQPDESEENSDVA
jgi:3-hydroxybutyryl-CoA dehydrogenase